MYSMEGPDGGRDSLETMGMIPRAILQIFDTTSALKIKGILTSFLLLIFKVHDSPSFFDKRVGIYNGSPIS